MDGPERRKFKRLGAKLEISSREVGSTASKPSTGCTLNVCPDGLCFETESADFKPGSLLEVELSIPPKRGLLEFGGRLSGFARVLRTYDIPAVDINSASGKRGVAVQFCRAPKLCM